MLEDWQHIKKVPKHFYYVGKARFKFRGNYNEELSDKTRYNLYENIQVYDVLIFDFVKLKNSIDYQDLKQNKKGPTLNPVLESVQAISGIDDKKYNLNPL
mgnify:CR=1 FL=1